MNENPPTNPVAPESATQSVPQNSPPPPAPPEKKNAGATMRKLNSPGSIFLGTVVLAFLLFTGLVYLVEALTHESTDDAFIAGHIISIAPRVAGQISAVHVLDNEFVHSNDLLIELDPADYITAAAQKKAAQQAGDADYQAAVAAYHLMEVKVTTAEADARSSRADAAAATATAARAKADFERYQELLQQKTISQQEFDTENAAFKTATANQNSAEQHADADESKVNEARAQIEAAKAEAASVFAKSDRAKTDVEAAQLNLSYTKIFAPADGRVTRKQVEVGDYIQSGQQLFSIVPAEIWVVGNFKESQLRKMKPGQPALVEIDALGRHKFRAHVDSVQAGSGAAFSLLPPENATGNFVKVIQRVPVKIIFDEPLPADKTIGPGLSVTPSVQISSFNFPDWALAFIAIILAVVAALIFVVIARREPANP